MSDPKSTPKRAEQSGKDKAPSKGQSPNGGRPMWETQSDIQEVFEQELLTDLSAAKAKQGIKIGSPLLAC